MSQNRSLTEEEIASAQARDKRLRLLGISLDVAAELQNSAALRVFMSALDNDAKQAMKDFAGANSADLAQVIPLQVRVKSNLFLTDTIEMLFASATVAEQSIQQEDEALADGG